ncbi:hypothetical protein KEM48_007416 [Puccinia striiformis f. sp. tritici PST-130]|nr:hypothetical protein KEM48_007416 [Puccinia striiformis f. sp. tritici PST-130]
MARSSQSRSPIPSQPPSRRSTRQIITPARFNQIPTPSDINSQNSSAFFRARRPQLSQSDNRKRSCKRLRRGELKDHRQYIKKSSPFDKVTDYFEEPHYQNKGDAGKKLMYECKWCRHVYKKSEVAAGCKLPITSQELDKLDVTHHQGTMTEYLKTKAFDLKVFNQLLVMWLVRFSLPWS